MSTESRNEDLSGEPAPDKNANLSDLGDAGHPFDQTNGIVDGLEGESDGEAEASTSGTTDLDDTLPDADGDGSIAPPVLPSGR
jgi:hypothetical protein